MLLSELIQYYRTKCNLSLEALGTYVQVSKSTIQRWESGETKNIPEAKLKLLSELFEVNIIAFLNGNVKPILGFVKAGYDFYANENILGYEEVTCKEAKQGDFYLRVVGDSMTGSRIYEGDLIYVKKNGEIQSGDLAVILLNSDEVTIKKVIYNDSNILLVSTNPLYEPKVYNELDVKEGRLQIIGKVIHSKISF